MVAFTAPFYIFFSEHLLSEQDYSFTQSFLWWDFLPVYLDEMLHIIPLEVVGIDGEGVLEDLAMVAAVAAGAAAAVDLVEEALPDLGRENKL